MESVKTRPGMARAVLASLARIWAADIRFDDPRFASARLSDLGRIEAYLRSHMPMGTLLPPIFATERPRARDAPAPRLAISISTG
ncbi:hypothetical protein [Neoaquamicrobium sediminum]|uniref:hypothetical protein n=1 Tax=Neoaquamicrobium sediminum TaxID=1849104 RepID=UPI001564999C|nr:hypothetical protein [Mesorhizobium sediminum]NRC57178.1 hypothetical protein [Mesorhizobium sediminum]